MLVFILHIFMLFITNIVYLLLLLIAVAYFTLLERKLMGSIQRRTGPKITGFYGILQPIADGIKLLTKEIIIPQKVSFFLCFQKFNLFEQVQSVNFPGPINSNLGSASATSLDDDRFDFSVKPMLLLSLFVSLNHVQPTPFSLIIVIAYPKFR